MSQSELANKTGLHIVTIGKYEIDWREPKATQLKLLADALGVKMEAFFNLKGGDMQGEMGKSQTGKKISMKKGGKGRGKG